MEIGPLDSLSTDGANGKKSAVIEDFTALLKNGLTK